MTTFRSASVLYSLAICLLVPTLSGCPQKKLVAFDDDNQLNAEIRRTDYGVPHIKADNLESLAFGVGYAFSEDNACMLLDIVTRYNSQRSQFYGPDKVPGSNDSENLITDFSYLALGIREQALKGYDSLSDNTKAMLSGYSKGFNHYLEVTGSDHLDPNCAGKPWVRSISELDMLTALLGTALLPGSGNFLAPLFLATPPNTDFAPTPLLSSNTATKPDLIASLPQPHSQLLATHIKVPRLLGKNPNQLGSNAWAIGKQLSENGKGMLLANPHFPHTGILRFWQFHSTIPGVLDVMGASLHGTPAIVNIGFNRNLAWSHTYSEAEHFIVYQLDLDESDATGLTYIVDGQPHTIEEKTLTLNVAVGPNSVLPFSKTVYYSKFGPMVVIPGALPWGTDDQKGFVAYSIKDANKANFDIVDHWLGMNLAKNMNDFKQAFKHYDGVLFNNTLAVDRKGNAFFIDDSTVPDLTPLAEQALRTDPQLIQARELLGFSVLPGTSSLFDFNGPVPYANAPKLERRDYVQNSNDSYWLTNPNAPLTDYSILYGKTATEQSLRSRMSHALFASSAGNNDRYSLDELEAVLFSGRAYLAEAVLDDLVQQCLQQGNTPVQVDINDGIEIKNMNVSITAECQALAQWDGLFKRDSRGAHVFREFAQQFATDPQWQVAFDQANPTETPHTLANNDIVMQHLARAAWVLSRAGVDLNATLGEVQYVEHTNLDGSPSGDRIPWEGGNNIEGGFNVFRAINNDSSLIPRHSYPALFETQISEQGMGYQINQGSSWIMLVNFTDKGVSARGLLTYSQSIDPTSVHREDQTRLYSNGPHLRDIYFSEEDIETHKISSKNVTLMLD